MNAFRGHSWHGCLEMQTFKNTEFLLSEVGTHYYGFPARLLECKEDARLCCGSRANHDLLCCHVVHHLLKVKNCSSP